MDRQPVMTLELIPPVGFKVENRGFLYEVTAAEPHMNRDGTPSMLVTWRGQCAECGGAYSFTLGRIVHSFRRRCEEHNVGWRRAKPFDGFKGWVKAQLATTKSVEARELLERVLEAYDLFA